MKKYSPILMRMALKEKSWCSIDAVIELWTPAFVNMFAVVLFISGTKLVFPDSVFTLSGAPREYWFSLAAMSMLYVCTGLVAAKADFLLYKAILYFPVYLLWKIQLYVKMAYNGLAKDWVRTTRER